MERGQHDSFSGASDLKSSSSYRLFKMKSNESNSKIGRARDRRSVLVVDHESYVLMFMEQFFS